MARGYTARKLEVYSLHASTDGGQVAYSSLFRVLASTPPENRAQVRGDGLVALPTLTLSRGSAWLIADEGAVGVNPLIFNSLQARERIQRLRSGEIVAHKTHALIDLNSRQGIIEYNHRGAKATDLAAVIEETARQDTRFQSLTVELNPVADEEFVRAIDRFKRIRVASLRVARPNPDWTDYYNHLTALANESDARTVEVTLNGERGDSLPLNKRVVGIIKDLVAAATPILKGASLSGMRRGEAAETTISLANHIEHQRVSVRLTDDGHVRDDDIRARMQDYLDSRSRRHVR